LILPSGSEKASVEAGENPKKENGFENTDSLAPCKCDSESSPGHVTREARLGTVLLA